MSDQLKLVAEPRTEFGKGAARRARAAGKIPAVLYGHGSEPVHVLLPGHDTFMALKHQNALLTIELGKDSELAIAKDVQRDPVKRTIDHVDLLIVKKGEKITVDVPVHVLGESAPGTIHVVEYASIQVQAEATHLPEGIEVTIDGLEDGAKVTAGEIALPKGVELVTDGETVVVVVSTPRRTATPEEADAAAAEEAPAADEAAE